MRRRCCGLLLLAGKLISVDVLDSNYLSVPGVFLLLHHNSERLVMQMVKLIGAEYACCAAIRTETLKGNVHNRLIRMLKVQTVETSRAFGRAVNDLKGENKHGFRILRRRVFRRFEFIGYNPCGPTFRRAHRQLAC